MNAQEAIQILAKDYSDDAIQILAEAVEAASEYGDPDGSLTDWIGNGEYDGTETVESLAAEWDSDR